MPEDTCSKFQEHAFKKDLCVNCLKTRRLHSQPQPTRRPLAAKSSEDRGVTKEDKKLASERDPGRQGANPQAKRTAERPAAQKPVKPNVASKPTGLKKLSPTEEIKDATGGAKVKQRSTKPTISGAKPKGVSKPTSPVKGSGTASKSCKDSQALQITDKECSEKSSSPHHPKAPPPDTPVPVFRKSNDKPSDSEPTPTNEDVSMHVEFDRSFPDEGGESTKPQDDVDIPPENVISEESHYYHKYDVAMKGMSPYPKTVVCRDQEDPRKRMLLEKLHEKIEAGEVADISTDSIAMPYTVVEISKFPPNLSVTEELPPKLPDTPAPQTSACNTLNKTSSKSGSTETLDTTSIRTVKQDREKSHTPSPKARTRLQHGKEDEAVPQGKSSPDLSRAEPVLPVVLHEEAKKMKAAMKSPATPRKVPIMIQPQDNHVNQDGMYEPVDVDEESEPDRNDQKPNIKTPDTEFTRQCPARASAAKSEAFEAKMAAISKISFGGAAGPTNRKKPEETEPDTMQEPNTVTRKTSEGSVTVHSTKIEVPTKQEMKQKQDKSKKGGRSFFKKLLKIGSGKECVEGTTTVGSSEEDLALTTGESVDQEPEASDDNGIAVVTSNTVPHDIKTTHRQQSIDKPMLISVADVKGALAKRKVSVQETKQDSTNPDVQSESSQDVRQMEMKPVKSDTNLEMQGTNILPLPAKEDRSKKKCKNVQAKALPNKDTIAARLPVESKVIQHSSTDIPSPPASDPSPSLKEDTNIEEASATKPPVVTDEPCPPVPERTFKPGAKLKPAKRGEQQLLASVEHLRRSQGKDFLKELEVQVDSLPSTKLKRVSPRKKPGVPPPALPPTSASMQASPPASVPQEHIPLSLDQENKEVSVKQKHTTDIPPETIEPFVLPSHEDQPSENEALMAQESCDDSFQNEQQALPLSRDNSFEGPLVRSPSSESKTLSMEEQALDEETDLQTRRRPRPKRSESRQSKVIRKMMGAPPPPPPPGSGDRRSVSEGSEPGSQPTSPSPSSPIHTTTQPTVSAASQQPISPKTTSPKAKSKKSSKVSMRSLEISGPVAVTPMMGGMTINFPIVEKGSTSPTKNRDISKDDAPTPKKRIDSVKKHKRNRTVTEGIQPDLTNLDMKPVSPDDRVHELLEKRSSKFLNRALPPPPCSPQSQAAPAVADMSSNENFYEFVPSENGQISSTGTPASDSRTCYEDIDLDEIYDDPADLMYSGKTSSTSSSSHHSHMSQASQGSLPRSQSNDYLEPVSAKDEKSPCDEGVYPDIIPASAIMQKNAKSLSLDRGRPVPAPRGQTPPRRQAKKAASRISQHYIMPYVNVEMSIDKDRPALTVGDGFRKMSVLNLETLQTVGEEMYARYVCPEAEFRDDLGWSDFSIGVNGIELTQGLFGFYKAYCAKVKPHNCYLMVSGKSLRRSVLEHCHANVINPIAMFRDRISADYFPEPPGSQSQVYQLFGMEQTNIAVLSYSSVRSLTSFIQEMHRKNKTADDWEFERISCYVMAQILNGLLYLHEKDDAVTKLHSNDILVVSTESGETYPVVNISMPNRDLDGHENQLFDSIINLIFLVLRVDWNKEEDPYTAIPEKSKFSRAFKKLVSLLYQKQFTMQSLIMARNILEYMLWGPNDQEIKAINGAEAQDQAYSVWLELSRCKLVNHFAVSKTEPNLEQASLTRFLCSMTGASLSDTVKILDINV